MQSFLVSMELSIKPLSCISHISGAIFWSNYA